MRNIRIHVLLFLTQTTKRSCFQFNLEPVDRTEWYKQLSNNCELRFNVFYMASDLYLNIWSCWNTDRAAKSTGKPVSILCGIAKKMSPFLVLNLFNTCCPDCCMIFVLTRHILSVTIFIKCFSPILLYFILCCLYISGSKLSYKSYCL